MTAADRYALSGHVTFFALCAAVLLAAFLMDTTPEVVSLWGWDVPLMCTWKRFFGIECPGCGLTRSFVFLAHGDVRSAFELNLMGPPLFLLVASQVVYRPYALWRDLRKTPREKASQATNAPGVRDVGV